MGPLELGALTPHAPKGDDLVLAVESATERPAVALLRGGVTLAVHRAESDTPAAEFVLPAVERVLAEAHVRVPDVDLFALAIGPGSFTGLRVGLATVKGLCFAGDRPVAAVPTLLALCLAGGSERGPVAALLDARRGDVYAAAYGPGRGDGEEELLAEGLHPVSGLGVQLPAGCRLVGGGASLLAAAHPERGFVSSADACGTPVEAVGRLGLRMLARGETHPADRLVPRYLRRAEAEVRRTGHAVESKNPF